VKRRWVALIVLMAAMAAILAIGFYRSVTGKDTRPQDSGPSLTPAARAQQPR
jgi:hypothetical protein